VRASGQELAERSEECGDRALPGRVGHQPDAPRLTREAAQPMSNRDDTMWIVFNGEIYNHADLRKELEILGHKFTTHHSDTEVILKGYEQWGEEVLPRLHGMFAFGIWDKIRGKFGNSSVELGLVFDRPRRPAAGGRRDNR